MSYPDIIQSVSSYYAGKLSEHGPTPQGVDWNSAASQELRFLQMIKAIPHSNPYSHPISINDLGCGYGALVDYLQTLSLPFDYTGYDVSPNMIQTARTRYPSLPNVRFLLQEEMNPAQYTLASGIFNVKQGVTDEAWLDYIRHTLHQMDRSSTDGFAFNILTACSDPEYRQSTLYYADPCLFFDYCKKHFSRNVALLHDYHLYEFTIIVRKAFE